MLCVSVFGPSVPLNMRSSIPPKLGGGSDGNQRIALPQEIWGEGPMVPFWSR